MMANRKSQLRRLMAGVALLGVGFGTFEPAVGLVRDGAIHHEGGVEAAQRATSQRGEHGHEHAVESASDTHGPEHQHGTGVDHCTHMHGPAATTFVSAFSISIESHGVARIEPALRDQLIRAPPFHPPKL